MAVSQGYIMLARKIRDSWIWQASPLHLKVWLHLLLECSHTDGQKKGMKLGRGQCLITLQNLQNTCQYHQGYRKKTPSKSHLTKILRRLREGHMIDTAKTTRGLIVTVCKYDSYQRASSYEGNADGHTADTRRQQPVHTIDKNGKNGRIKETPNLYVIFDEAREVYPGTKRGGQTEFANFQKKHKDWREVLPVLKAAINIQILRREGTKGFVPTWKNFKTWINQRCWEEEPEKEQPNGKRKTHQREFDTTSEFGTEIANV